MIHLYRNDIIKRYVFFMKFLWIQVLSGEITVGTFLATFNVYKDLGDRFGIPWNYTRDMVGIPDGLLAEFGHIFVCAETTFFSWRGLNWEISPRYCPHSNRSFVPHLFYSTQIMIIIENTTTNKEIVS